MAKVHYSCTALQGTNKTGELAVDEHGYYTVVLGAFDFPNSTGAIYPWKSAKRLFESSGSLLRRINQGQLRGECGHPKKEVGMTQNDFVQRILTIEETKVSCHISEVWMDDSGAIKDKFGRPVVTIMGKVRPCGKYGDALKAKLENPKENVAFSLRSLTKDTTVGSQRFKHATTIVTWDEVNEPGISIATKYNNPALESIDQEALSETAFTSAANDIEASGVGLESGLDIIEVIADQGFEASVERLGRIDDW